MLRPKGLHESVRIYRDPTEKSTRREEAEQMTASPWFKHNYPQYDKLFFHVPNEGSKTKSYALKMKKMGLTKGVADLILLVPMNGYPFAVFEMKKIGTGRIDPHQREHLNAAAEQGAFVCVCWGANQFKKAVADYLQ